MSSVPSTLSKPRPFALGKVPLQVSESEFNLCFGLAALPLVVSIVISILTGIFIPPLYAIGLGVVVGAFGAVFFSIIKRGKPDSYLYDYAHRVPLFRIFIQPKRGSIAGRQRIIAAVEPFPIAKPWGGIHESGPRTELEVLLPADGRSGNLPVSVRHPTTAVSARLLFGDEADRG